MSESKWFSVRKKGNVPKGAFGSKPIAAVATFSAEDTIE
jgi:hypothetical protein